MSSRLNGFFLWSTARRREIAQSGTKAKQTDLSRALSQEWREMPQETRDNYSREARAQREQPETRDNFVSVLTSENYPLDHSEHNHNVAASSSATSRAAGRKDHSPHRVRVSQFR